MPGLHLAPNVRDTDGTPAYVHFSERDLPLVVELPLPALPARDSTPEETREAVASAFRAWERALQLIQPEFRLAFTESHANPDLRAVWTKRPPASLPAQGSIDYQVTQEAGQPVLRVSAAITLSTQPLPGARHRVSLGELRAYALHAFGSALGLADCRACDSIMSDDWRRRRKKEVTDLDLLTYEALIGLPNGIRRDGRRLRALEGDTAVVGARVQEQGVLADLPFINTGRGGTPYIDLAAPGKRSFTLALDTGAADTILTDAYARALGISVRATKQDRYRRSTITGRSLEFWCMGQRVVGGGRGPTHFDYALLGGRFLENFVVGIDFGARRVRFLDPGVHRVGDEGSGNSEERVIDLRISEARPYAELRVGEESVWALVDTGADATLILSEEAARKLKIAIDPDAERVRMRNVLGTQVTLRQRLARAQLGPFELENIELQISLADESSVRVERWLQGEAIIGVQLLEKFRVRIDYPRAKLGLSPTRPARPPAEPERDAVPDVPGA
ncbi:MAG: aspartyl protease family protein [Myxococcales bacterium]|nr:aspartyl protease family protein [Myxococcales bacterium]